MSDLEAAFLTWWHRLAPNEPEPEAQVRFAPPRRWRLDFAWPARMVAVEVHGGTWAGGRHTRGGGFRGDREKCNAAQVRGWKVIELTGDMLEDDPAGCVEMVLRALRPGGWA